MNFFLGYLLGVGLLMVCADSMKLGSLMHIQCKLYMVSCFLPILSSHFIGWMSHHYLNVRYSSSSSSSLELHELSDSAIGELIEAASVEIQSHE